MKRDLADANLERKIPASQIAIDVDTFKRDISTAYENLLNVLRQDISKYSLTEHNSIDKKLTPSLSLIRGSDILQENLEELEKEVEENTSKILRIQSELAEKKQQKDEAFKLNLAAVGFCNLVTRRAY
uniref:Uncharacterized protein n=1 Tax=Palpitomonas bilix TaxID=652834 RepID=A0A7S3GHA1_9EUKA|mmetsp:Transcript_49348/g.127229  ORF Transcript_49348/g.127229 Transcript_49348/m.127229 type:complete len:128 (+) Transcript_49348:91-474(+)